MKISIEQVEATLLERKIDKIKVQEIIKDLQQVVEEEKADHIDNAPKKQKFEYAIIINDTEGKIKDELTGFVVQQQEGQDMGLILSKLSDAAKSQNDAAKRKKTLIKSFVELFESLKSKFAKEKGLRIKTKTAVRVLVNTGKTI